MSSVVTVLLEVTLNGLVGRCDIFLFRAMVEEFLVNPNSVTACCRLGGIEDGEVGSSCGEWNPVVFEFGKCVDEHVC